MPDPKLLERAKARWYKREIVSGRTKLTIVHRIASDVITGTAPHWTQVPDFDVDGVSNGASSAPRPSADAAPEPSAGGPARTLSSGHYTATHALCPRCRISQRPTRLVSWVAAESSGGAASDAPAPSQNPQPQAPAGSSFLARLRTSLQKNGGFERVLFMNHILLIIL